MTLGLGTVFTPEALTLPGWAMGEPASAS